MVFDVIEIGHFRNEKGTGGEMGALLFLGSCTGNAQVRYWPIFFPVLSNSPRSLCEI